MTFRNKGVPRAFGPMQRLVVNCLFYTQRLRAWWPPFKIFREKNNQVISKFGDQGQLGFEVARELGPWEPRTQTEQTPRGSTQATLGVTAPTSLSLKPFPIHHSIPALALAPCR